jgi:hypothetical protein
MGGSLLGLVAGAALLAVTLKGFRPDPNPKDRMQATIQPLTFAIGPIIGAGLFLLGLAGIISVLVTGDNQP